MSVSDTHPSAFQQTFIEKIRPHINDLKLIKVWMPRIHQGVQFVPEGKNGRRDEQNEILLFVGPAFTLWSPSRAVVDYCSSGEEAFQVRSG